MRNRNIIRLYFEPQSLSVINRAKFLAQKQALISESLNKFNWLLFDKTAVDLNQQEDVAQLFKKRIKKRIQKSTVIKNIEDDYLDDTNTIDGYYASKRFDDDASFTYSIGSTKHDYDSSLVIINFDSLNELNRFDGLKHFIFYLINIFEPYSIEVSEYKFFREKMDLRSDEYWFGWMTYFSNKISIPEVPPGIKVEDVGNKGKLIITTEDFFTSDNSEHFNRAKSLVNLFRNKNIHN